MGVGEGGAETTSLAMRRVLHLWEETPVILSQKKYGLLPLHTGDLRGIEIG